MTPCARGCCWNPYGCALSRQCPCHWDERNGYAPTIAGGAIATHPDPTANKAIGNVMRGKSGK